MILDQATLEVVHFHVIIGRIGCLYMDAVYITTNYPQDLAGLARYLVLVGEWRKRGNGIRCPMDPNFICLHAILAQKADMAILLLQSFAK